MYDLIINTHVVVSTIYIVLGIVTLIRAIRGMVAEKTFLPLDNYLSLSFVLLLYIQLILGFWMYFYPGAQELNAGMTIADAYNAHNVRFWVVSHFSVMIFALILSQLGRIHISNNLQDVRKFRNTVFYYGISYILVLISAGLGSMR